MNFMVDFSHVVSSLHLFFFHGSLIQNHFFPFFFETGMESTENASTVLHNNNNNNNYNNYNSAKTAKMTSAENTSYEDDFEKDTSSDSASQQQNRTHDSIINTSNNDSNSNSNNTSIKKSDDSYEDDFEKDLSMDDSSKNASSPRKVICFVYFLWCTVHRLRKWT